jgi:hypothetical protein
VVVVVVVAAAAAVESVFIATSPAEDICAKAETKQQGYLLYFSCVSKEVQC